VQFFLDARGEDADHAFVPAFIEEGNAGGGVIGVQGFEQDECLILHVRFDFAALAVQVIEFLRNLQGTGGIVGGQAFNAQTHVGQTTGGIEARPEQEAEVESGGTLGVPSGGFEQSTNAGLHAAGAHALQALADQDAVVAVEFDHVGHRAERDEVEQVGKVWFGMIVEIAPFAQLGTQGKGDIEHDAHPGDALGGEIAARLVRIDDAVGGRQGLGRQVMIGNKHGNAVFLGAGDAFQTGDAVVDGDDEVRREAGGDIDDLRREAVTQLETVRDEEVDRRPQTLQRTQADGRGGGAVTVVVADDQQAGFRFDGVGEDLGGIGGVRQAGRWQQGLQFVIEFGLVGDPACSVEAGKQRVQALLFELPDGAGGGIAGDEAGHAVAFSARWRAVSASGRGDFQNVQRAEELRERRRQP